MKVNNWSALAGAIIICGIATGLTVVSSDNIYELVNLITDFFVALA